MTPSRAPALRLVLLLGLLVAAACTIPNPLFVEPDADADGDGDSDGDGDADADADADADGDGDGDADSDADGDGDGDVDSDSDADGDADGDADEVEPGFVRRLGVESCGETSAVITLGDGVEVAAGHRVVLRVGLRGADGGTISATDSAGNAYGLDGGEIDPEGAGVRVAVLSARVARALGPGDTITVTHPVAEASVVVADELQGLGAMLESDGSVGYSMAPLATLSLATAPALLVAATAHTPGPGCTPDPAWEALDSAEGPCGGTSRVVAAHASWRLVTEAPAEVSFAASLAYDARWATVIVAYGLE